MDLSNVDTFWFTSYLLSKQSTDPVRLTAGFVAYGWVAQQMFLACLVILEQDCFSGKRSNTLLHCFEPAIQPAQNLPLNSGKYYSRTEVLIFLLRIQSSCANFHGCLMP